MTSHSEITGDFDSAYTVKTTSHSEGGPAGTARTTTTTIEAKWLGACKPDQKPGDIVMPGGIKINIRDTEKLKSLLPKIKNPRLANLSLLAGEVGNRNSESSTIEGAKARRDASSALASTISAGAGDGRSS